MRVHLEGFVPYDEGIQWRISEAYFRERGISAWTEGDVPYGSTSSAPFTRQHAALFAGLVAVAGPHSGPIHVLDIGAGLGRFASAFLGALDELDAGRGLSERVRVVVSDVNPITVRDAIAAPALRDLAAAGRVVPALLDRATTRLTRLDGEPLDLPARWRSPTTCAT